MVISYILNLCIYHSNRKLIHLFHFFGIVLLLFYSLRGNIETNTPPLKRSLVRLEKCLGQIYQALHYLKSNKGIALILYFNPASSSAFLCCHTAGLVSMQKASGFYMVSIPHNLGT